MPNETSVPAPNSVEAQALAELEKEGHTVEGKEPAPAPEVKTPEPPKEKEEPKVETPEEETLKEEKKPDRTPTMVPAWKLKVAEDQASRKITELQEELKKLSEQKAPITSTQEETITDIKDEIAKLAADKDVDVEFLSKFADSILKKAEAKYRPSTEVTETVKKLQEERELEKQLNEYSTEFEKDVLPLLGEYSLSGDALSQLKNTLRDYAFSETYAKVPLKEIFAIKQGEFNLSQPRKSSEGKAVKSRGADIIDIDNISEDDFAKLPADKIEEFMQKKGSSAWQRK